MIFVSRKWPPAVGGMETYSFQLVRELQKRREVEVFALPGNKDGSAPSAWALLLFGITTACKVIFQRLPTLIHIGDMAIWPIGSIARLRRPSIRVIISAHGTDVSYHRRKGWRGRLYRIYLRLGAKLNRSSMVIVNSAATASAVAETGWKDTLVVPLATSLIAPAASPAHQGHMLFVGRLVERKGCLWFVQNVLPNLPEHIRLKVAGPVWDRAEQTALDDPRVDHLGALDQESLVKAYREAMCVVLPNIEPPSGEFEGFGLVAVEAAAVGGLVLAAATGGLVEAVEDGVTGYLLPAGDPDAWSAKIAEVAGWDGHRRHSFLANAMIRARQVYSWPRVADDVIRIYDSALARA